MISKPLSRREWLVLALGVAAGGTGTSAMAEQPAVTVHKDPNCGCCEGWVRHLRRSGFQTNVIESDDMQAVKSRLKVPDDLASCHTAEVAGYAVEGHVPGVAIRRLLAEKPSAIGLAVPGMPIGSPGMEGGGKFEPYDVILFGSDGRKRYMRFSGLREIL